MMTDLLAILTSNAPAWGITLTLVIAGLIVSSSTPRDRHDCND